VVEAFCDLVIAWKPIASTEEAGQIRAGIGSLSRSPAARAQGLLLSRVIPDPRRQIAQSIRGRAALEGLYVPFQASWYPALRSEMLSFPASKHDDQVDALGLVGIKGTAAKNEDTSMHGSTEMTFAEALKLAAPKRNAGRI
jgi:hypothetical protein